MPHPSALSPMRSLVAAAVLLAGVAAFGPASIAAPATQLLAAKSAPASNIEQIQYRRGYGYRGRGYVGRGIGLGIAGGIVAGALLAPRYYGSGYYRSGYYGSGYYSPYYGARSYYYDAPPARVYAAPGDDSVSYCLSRFRSYDPSSGTYLGYDGYRHPCP